jgi:LPS-assembly protein
VGPAPSWLPRGLTFLRNIIGRKCHELFLGKFCVSSLIALVLIASHAAAQPPPQVLIPQAPPPLSPASQQPNAANPNQRVHPPHANAPAADEFRVVSDTQETDGSMRHLRGHVLLETIDIKLTADEVDYDQDTGDTEFRGHVVYENFGEGNKLYCDHGKYNVNDETGIFWEVTGTSPAKILARPGLLTTNNPFYFEGKWAERKADRYVLHDGFVTDCKVPKPWWRLTGPKFDIFPGDHAIAYRSTFKIKRFPLFFSPAFYKSLKKTPRKSGFLTPHAGHSSRRGFMIGQGYYWAINRSYDLLYESQYFTERGFAHTFDFRGKVKPGTDFDFNLYGVNDRGLDLGNGQVQKQGGVLFTFNGKSDLGHGWEAMGQINYLSSFLFRQSFTESFHEAIFTESHSIGYLTKHWSSFGFYVVGERDVEFQSVLPDDKIVIRKLPEAEFLSRDRQIVGGIVPVWFSLESSAGIVDRTQPDFQTRQFVNRLDVNPRLTTAFHFGGFSIVPSFAVRETNYGSSIQGGLLSGNDILRSSREFRIELIPPSLARIYKSPKWLGGDKVKHVIEPRIEYVFVDGINDFRNIIRFDENDLLSNTNEVRYSLANRLFVKNSAGGVNEVLSWELSQSRYFDPTFGGAVVPGQRNVVQSSVELDGFAFLDGPRNYSPIVSALRYQGRVSFEWRADYDPLRKHISDSSLSADMRFSNYFISLGHTQVREDPALAPSSDQFRGLLGIGNGNRKGWNAAFSAFYDYKKGILAFATTQVTYNTDCCGISFQYRRFNFGSRDETQYRIAFAVSNVGSFGTLKKQERIF